MIKLHGFEKIFKFVAGSPVKVDTFTKCLEVARTSISKTARWRVDEEEDIIIKLNLQEGGIEVKIKGFNDSVLLV